MNRVIGLCVRTRDWPSPFAQHGYEVRLIEQRFTTQGGQQVKPDIIIASEKHRHMIFFDCKGGHTVEMDQLARYETLTPSDLGRWVRLHNAPVTHNLCLTFRSLEDKHASVVEQTKPHPILTLGDKAITKTRNFSIPELNHAFSSPISLAGMYPPASHYPFSDQDDDIVILPIVLRKLVELAFDRGRGGPSALEKSTFDNPKVVESTHPYWESLSIEHQKRLSDRVQTMMKELIATEIDLQKHIEYLESRQGYKVHGPLTQLRKLAEEIIIKRETQRKLSQFIRG